MCCLFIDLIHTCELARANPFDNLTQLPRHASELTANPFGMDALELTQAQVVHNHCLRPAFSALWKCPQNRLFRQRRLARFLVTLHGKRVLD